MRSHYFLKGFLLIALCVSLMGTARAGAVSVNGICALGNCASPDILAAGNSFFSPFDFVYTFANSDRYQVAGALLAINTLSPSGGGASLLFSPLTVTYLGNSSGTASDTDTLVISFLQNYQVFFTGPMEGAFEGISGNFGGPLGFATSVQGQLFINGAATPVLGPFFPPDPFFDFRTDLPFTAVNPSLAEFRYTLTFGAGSGPGATINVANTIPAAIPEPASMILLGTGLLGLVGAARKRRKGYPR